MIFHLRLILSIQPRKTKCITSYYYFSYDARSAGPENGKRWSDEERGFGKRAYLEVQKDTINQDSHDKTKTILNL